MSYAYLFKYIIIGDTDEKFLELKDLYYEQCCYMECKQVVISLVCLSSSILDRLGKSPFGLSQDHTTEGQHVHCWYMTSAGTISYSIVPIPSMVSFQG